jgi:hypothetical protein
MLKPNLLVLFVGLVSLVVLSACSSPAPAPSVVPVITVVNLQTPRPATPAPAPTLVPPTAAPAVTTTPYPTDAPAPTPQKITFDPGAVNKTVQGTLKKNGMDKWVLRILGGQTLNVNLVPTNGKAKLTIVGADGYPLITDHADAMQWTGQVPASQDYTITILAYEDTTPSYTLQITIPPLRTTVPPPAPVVKRINFAPNSISATVQGTLQVNGADQWALRILAGQTLNANVAATNGKARLVIWGADGTMLISDHADAPYWTGPVPSTQDYYIRVDALDNTAPSYSLTVTVPPR